MSGEQDFLQILAMFPRSARLGIGWNKPHVRAARSSACCFMSCNGRNLQKSRQLLVLFRTDTGTLARTAGESRGRRAVKEARALSHACLHARDGASVPDNSCGGDCCGGTNSFVHYGFMADLSLEVCLALPCLALRGPARTAAICAAA